MEFGFNIKKKPKEKPPSLPGPASFKPSKESDSESDEIKKANRDVIKSSLYSQNISQISSALAEDPTLLSYDLYKSKLEKQQQQKEIIKDPKYHENIKLQTEFKKRERLVIQERHEAKLRESEKEEFGETEEYFTESYLEYMKKNKIFEEVLEKLDKASEQSSISYKNPETFLNKLIEEPKEEPYKKAKTSEIFEGLEELNGEGVRSDKRTDSQILNAKERFLARKKQREIGK